MLIKKIAKWLQDYRVLLCSTGALAIGVVSLALQGANFFIFVNTKPILPLYPTTLAIEKRDAPTFDIFGVVDRRKKSPPPETSLQLTLLGSFVNRNEKNSSALIQSMDQRQQRYFIGDEIEKNARIIAIYSDRVDVMHNGNRESLIFIKDKDQQLFALSTHDPQSADRNQSFDRRNPTDTFIEGRMQSLREQIANTAQSDL